MRRRRPSAPTAFHVLSAGVAASVTSGIVQGTEVHVPEAQIGMFVSRRSFMVLVAIAVTSGFPTNTDAGMACERYENQVRTSNVVTFIVMAL